MLGLSLIAALIIIAIIWRRLALYGTSGTARVPTLWVVLGLPAFQVAAVVAYAGLLCTWGLVAVQTTRGSFGGSLFAPPPTAGPIKAVKDPPK